MPADAFFDTNVLVYWVSNDAAKADRAATLLRGGGHLSVQVLNEFADVALRKLRLAVPEVRKVMDAALSTCKLHDLVLDDTANALALTERHRIRFYDAAIVASALRAGCTTLWSEDLQHGLKVANRLTVRNPFAGDS